VPRTSLGPERVAGARVARAAARVEPGAALRPACPVPFNAPPRRLPGRPSTLPSMHERKLTRRNAVAALGTVSLGGLLAACGGEDGSTASVASSTGQTATVAPKTTTPASTAELFDASASCRLSTELTEGPYWFDVDAIRSDIREDREGTLLRLAIRVRDAASCEPIENAVVDIWHCDATGLYSGFEAASTGAPGGGGGPTDEETYLRGAQVTNAEGVVRFKTIYPGWYRGRTTHIHAKVHLDKRTLLTTQLFTTREWDDRVFAGDPYAGEDGRDTFNEGDGIFTEDGVMTLSKQEGGVLGVMTFDVRRS
jgi:protocatechuate 3,4-dioxygenase beta subunit